MPTKQILDLNTGKPKSIRNYFTSSSSLENPARLFNTTQLTVEAEKMFLEKLQSLAEKLDVAFKPTEDEALEIWTTISDYTGTAKAANDIPTKLAHSPIQLNRDGDYQLAPWMEKILPQSTRKDFLEVMIFFTETFYKALYDDNVDNNVQLRKDIEEYLTDNTFGATDLNAVLAAKPSIKSEILNSAFLLLPITELKMINIFNLFSHMTNAMVASFFPAYIEAKTKTAEALTTLKTECDNFQQYLEEKIRAEVTDLRKQCYEEYQAAVNTKGENHTDTLALGSRHDALIDTITYEGGPLTDYLKEESKLQSMGLKSGNQYTEQGKPFEKLIKQLDAVKEMRSELEKPNSNVINLQNFAAAFEAKKSLFDTSDNRIKQFLIKVGKILLGVVTFGKYIEDQAKKLHTSKSKFFQPRGDTFKGIAKKTTGSKKKRKN